MAKRMTAGDFAKERPEKAAPNLDVSGRLTHVLPSTYEQQIKAAVYVGLKLKSDRDLLWEVLGLDEVVDGRRKLLGLSVAAHRPEDVVCPKCLAPEGSPCVSDGGVPLHGKHVARKRLIERVNGEIPA